MEAKIDITNITHEDLVDFFSTALYGSTTFYGHLLHEYSSLEGDGPCYEDKIASVLLNGGEFAIVDMEAEGDVNGPSKGVKATPIDEYEVEYRFSLKDLENGLKRAFKDKKGGGFEAMLNLIRDDGCFDATDADILLQIIAFGEVVYG